MESPQQISCPIITVDKEFRSTFASLNLALSDANGMFISQRQTAVNFRHRKSSPGYYSDWHVAGDPTLIIVQQGCIELTLRNNQSRCFNSGQQFIAADYLPIDSVFNDTHGHRARVIGEQEFQAVHIKLSINAKEWFQLNSEFIRIAY